MALMLLLLSFIIASCTLSTTANSMQNHIIYVDPKNGSTDVHCWAGGLEMPCQNLEIALEGAKQIKNSAIMTLSPTIAEAKFSTKPNSIEQVDKYNNCPTWMNLNVTSGQCECGKSLHGLVRCKATLNKVSVLDCYLITFDEELEQVIVAQSFYGCGTHAVKEDKVYNTVPNNQSQINKIVCSPFNRDGRLCGSCREGYSPLVYSYKLKCAQCSQVESNNNWYKATAVAFIPLTLLYVLALLLHFDANSPSLHGFVIVAQLLSATAIVRVFVSEMQDYSFIYKLIGGVLTTLYSIWSLDFFRILYPEICLRVTTLQALFLEYSVAVYPPILILITYFASKLHSQGYKIVIWAWKPFQICLLRMRKKWDIHSSMIDVFATFLLLSYTKLLSVNFDLLAFIIPFNSTGNTVGTYLYYDASYEYFGRRHLPYGLVALFIFMCFNVLPLLLLLLYPMKWFQRFLNYFKLNHFALHTFFDSFAGWYKDGTEPGTRDCRYFAALFLLLRILLYIAYEATLTVYFYGLCVILFAIYTIALIIAKPYRPIYNKYNTLTPLMFIVIIMITVSIMNLNLALIKVNNLRVFSIIVTIILTSSPQLYIIGVACSWMYRQNLIKPLILKYRKVMILKKSDGEVSLLTATAEYQIQH